MKEKKSVFQFVVLGVFGFSIIAAVLVFAGLTSTNKNQEIGNVILWGTFEEGPMNSFLTLLNEEDNRAGHIQYEYKEPETYNEVLVEALASGQGPDLIFIDDAHLLRHWDKLKSITYESMSERTFRDTFADETHLLLGPSGIKGLPVLIDPLILFWNRDIFAESGFSEPPKFWSELFLISERMTKKTSGNAIERSAISFGGYDNVKHAKDIISALIMQSGGDIVLRTPDGQIVAGLAPQGVGNKITPAYSSLRFYTEFADPSKVVYTWNSSLDNSIDLFAQANLGIFIGRASDTELIKAKNPHLNFDVALFPQLKSGENKKILTHGNFYLLAVPNVAQNKYGAFLMMELLASKRAQELFTNEVKLPSARRDILAVMPKDPSQAVYRDSALISHSWLDPNAEKTNEIFRKMINNITSGGLRVSDSIHNANEELRAILQN